MHTNHFLSPIGDILITANEEKIVGIWIDKDCKTPDNLDRKYPEEKTVILENCKRWIFDYFDGKNPSCESINYELIGNEIKKIIWEEIGKIPYGNVMPFDELTRIVREKAGYNVSLQTISRAVQHNPLELIIPGHRVVSKDYEIKGDFLKVHTKLWLLNHEGVDISKLYVTPFNLKRINKNSVKNKL